MDKYYYIAAQLPLLTFGQKPTITKEVFLEEAKKWLTDGEYSNLSKVDLNDFHFYSSDTVFLRGYKTFEEHLRVELAKYRKAKKTRREYILPEEIIEIKDKNPLEAEGALLYKRWEWLEEKGVEHFFDFTFLVLYFLKLQILERLFTFNKERGKEVFSRICKRGVKDKYLERKVYYTR